MYVSGCVHVDEVCNDRVRPESTPVRAPTAVTDQRAERAWITDLLDLHDGRLGIPLLDDAGIARLLATTRRIAIVGASSDGGRPSNGVLRQLRSVGYDIVPINPNEETVDGLACYPDLASAVAATGPVDIVDVFRRSDQCATHAREAVAVKARCLWLQLGVASREAGLIAIAGGLEVVMDRCTIIEHRRVNAVVGGHPA
jgi:uncharacterized protein